MKSSLRQNIGFWVSKVDIFILGCHFFYNHRFFKKELCVCLKMKWRKNYRLDIFCKKLQIKCHSRISMLTIDIFCQTTVIFFHLYFIFPCIIYTFCINILCYIPKRSTVLYSNSTACVKSYTARKLLHLRIYIIRTDYMHTIRTYVYMYVWTYLLYIYKILTTTY